jgi:hypothetical protein
MELFIQIRDGQPFQHPIFGDNFREAFPHVDTNNLPPEFARFERIQPPAVGVYEVLLGPSYQWTDGIVKDVWLVRPMNAQEKTAKQEQVKSDWAQHGFPSWSFNEEACSFVSPVPYPTDGQLYRWDEVATSWVVVEVRG